MHHKTKKQTTAIRKKQLESKFTDTNQRSSSRYQQNKPNDSSSPITKNEEKRKRNEKQIQHQQRTRSTRNRRETETTT